MFVIGLKVPIRSHKNECCISCKINTGKADIENCCTSCGKVNILYICNMYGSN